eukprot:jgi/Chlat1/928/Chrsp108S01363
MRSHTGERPYVCTHPGCEKSYTRREHLNRHAQTHIAEAPQFACSVPGCGITCNNGDNFLRHMRQMHGHALCCEYNGCGLSFASEYYLNLHHAQHAGVKPHACAICGKRFKYPSMLQRHMLHHEESSTFFCCDVDGCMASFHSKPDLQRHTLDAHGTRRFSCELCAKQFTERRKLAVHMRVHMDDRPLLVCSIGGCGKAYTTHSNLKTHIRAYHLQEKPYVCSHSGCGAIFAHKRSHVNHERKRHVPCLKGPCEGKRLRTEVSQLMDIVAVSQHQQLSLRK